VIKVTWHKAALPPHSRFGHIRQIVPMCPPSSSNTCFFGPIRVHISNSSCFDVFDQLDHCDASMFALAAKYHIETHDVVRSSVARIKDSSWFYFSELV